MDAIRNGRFSSSGIVALTTWGSREMTEAELINYKAINPKGRKKNIEVPFGDAAYTYIAEKNMERMMGCSINTESDAKPLSWGKLLEGRVFDMLGIDYTLTSNQTFEHPTMGDIWVGSPDGARHWQQTAVTDIKCPFTRKSFCQLVMPLYCGLEGIEAMNAIRFGFTYKGLDYAKHKDGETYYWQLVSNAIIRGTTHAELIPYMPYQSELSEIKLRAEGEGSASWIQWKEDNELPYLPDGGHFKNINVIRFEVPKEDKRFLTERVMKAGEMLIKEPSILLATRDNPHNITLIEKA